MRDEAKKVHWGESSVFEAILTHLEVSYIQ